MKLTHESNQREVNTKMYEMPNTKTGIRLGWAKRTLLVITFYTDETLDTIQSISKEWKYSNEDNTNRHIYKSTFETF
tara:strand:+ start:233 stop:463 length:231 start_codon:yes stop_codon:yes gene_type:complete